MVKRIYDAKKFHKTPINENPEPIALDAP